jgi:glycosyltransferase involved in cell wall biosynthesis
MSPPRLACLLPARNSQADLPAYLESAQRFADTVLALDDGSTDATATYLGRAPLVSELLRNPRRPSYAGWDDRNNRQRLLRAAIEHRCEWVIFLDADERIDPSDARALREFVDRDADSNCAYSFRWFRMLGDGYYDDAHSNLWMCRLFAPRRGHELPDQRLHLVPVPTAIPRAKRHRTTVRIQHFGAMTRERRLARARKYEEADPERYRRGDYRVLLSGNGRRRPWPPRPPGLPMLPDRASVAAVAVNSSTNSSARVPR